MRSNLVLSIIAIGISLLAVGITGYNLYTNHLEPFNPEITTGNPMISLIPESEGSDNLSLGMLVPIDIINTGARGGIIKDFIIRLDSESDEYPCLFLRSDYFSNEFSLKAWQREFNEPMHPIYLNGNERIYQIYIFYLVTQTNIYPIFPLSKSEIPRGKYTFTLFTLDSSSNKYREVNQFSFILDEHALEILSYGSYMPYPIDVVESRDAFFDSMVQIDAIDKIALNIIPEPVEGSRAVIVSESIPVFKGNGKVDYVCGNCGALIAEKIDYKQIVNVVVICPRCGQYNEFP